MTEIRPDHDATIAFLQSTKPPSGKLHITAINPDALPKPKIVGHSFEDSNSAKAALDRASRSKMNLYGNYSDIIPLNSKYKRMKAKENDVTWLICFHVDADTDKTITDPVEFAKAHAKRLTDIMALPQPPNVVIDTGNGHGLFWYLDKWVKVTAANRDLFKRINIALKNKYDGDAVQDLCHIMRLPGTLNYPNKRKRARGRPVSLARLIRDDRDLLPYTLEDFEAAPVGTPDPQCDDEAVALDIPKDVDLSRFPTWLQKLITDGPAEGQKIGDGSRSAATFHVAAQLREAGATDGEIAAILTNPDFAISAHTLEQTQRGDPINQVRKLLGDLRSTGVTAIPEPEEDVGTEPEETLSPDEEKEQARIRAANEKLEQKQQQIKARAKAAEKNQGRFGAETNLMLNLQELTDQFVYVTQIKQYASRTQADDDGEPLTYDVDGFNLAFMYLRGDFSNVTKRILERRNMRMLNRVVFEPGKPEFTDNRDWNQYRPSRIVPKKADTPKTLAAVKLFYDHTNYLLPPGDGQGDLLLNWCAGVLQNLSVKPRHHILFQGTIQGTGKTFYARLLCELIGRSNCQALTQDILETTFTGWAMRCKFNWCEEVRDATGNRKTTAKLHTWASENRITINQKNMRTFVMLQCIAIMLFSNTDDPLKLDMSDRRYANIRTHAKVHPQGSKYYDALYGINGVGGILGDDECLAAIYWELLNRDLKGYSIEQMAPFTDTKRETIIAGQTPVAKYLIDHPPQYSVVDPDEMVALLPRHLRHQYAGEQVRAALRDHFNGFAWPRQVRLDGRSGKQTRVWLLHDLADDGRGAVAEKRPAKLGRQGLSVVQLYRNERDTVNTVATDEADLDLEDLEDLNAE